MEEDDDSYGLFHQCRPEGKGVETLLAGLPRAAEVVARLLSVYAATADGGVDDDAQDAYFVVRRPPSSSPDELLGLARQHLARMSDIAKEARSRDLTKLLSSAKLHVDGVEADEPPEGHDDESLLYDVVGDWFGELEPCSPKVESLDEAFYSLACDYNLAYYLQWPWYRDGTRTVEPFLPYFELWRRGAGVILVEPLRFQVWRNALPPAPRARP